jgi:hypothetical protein|nr:MAG TPA: hypothetical protein [Caudoviricetes sp.]
MATIDDLKIKANLIANATKEGENTAKRVGGLFNDVIALIEEKIDKGDTTQSELVQVKERLTRIDSKIKDIEEAFGISNSTGPATGGASPISPLPPNIRDKD